jgi:hypothetical protein
LLGVPFGGERFGERGHGHGERLLRGRPDDAPVEQDGEAALMRSRLRLPVEALRQLALLAARMRDLLVQRTVAREVEDGGGGFIVVVVGHLLMSSDWMLLLFPPSP